MNISKAEAKELIMDVAKNNGHNIFDAASFANNYLNDPNRTIEFSDDDDIKCPHCGSTELIRVSPLNHITCDKCGYTDY